jgi:hypothetical protein
MLTALHKHDISDKVWSLLESPLPGQRGQGGGFAHDTQKTPPPRLVAVQIKRISLWIKILA